MKRIFTCSHDLAIIWLKEITRIARNVNILLTYGLRHMPQIQFNVHTFVGVKILVKNLHLLWHPNAVKSEACTKMCFMYYIYFLFILNLCYWILKTIFSKCLFCFRLNGHWVGSQRAVVLMLTEDKGEEEKDERDVLSPPISHPAMRQRPPDPLREGMGVTLRAITTPTCPWLPANPSQRKYPVLNIS